MKIIILGAGQVGSSVAETLVSERNDITVIDLDPRPLAILQERYDLRGLEGNGAHISILRDAGADDADMLIACTRFDEVNLVACKVAKQVFNIPICVARARSPEFLDHPELMGVEGFGVDHLICPERSVTNYLQSLIDFPEALQVLEFGNRMLTLVALRAYSDDRMVGQSVETLVDMLPDIDFRVLAIFRNNRAIMAQADTVIELGDEVFCIAASKDIRRVVSHIHRKESTVRRIMIGGGGNIGLRLAKQLENTYELKIVEPNRRRCEFLAAELSSGALVLNGDATDETLFEDENIAEMDFYVSLTNSDENNIMSALLAKRMGARRVMALIGRRSYGDLMQGGRIDIAISPAHATISELLRYVRRGDIVSLHTLRRGTAEIIEAIAHGDRKHSKVVGRSIQEIALPGGTVLCALVREDQVLMPHHDTVIQENDHVVVLVTNRRLIPKVEKLFQVSPSFF